MANEELKDAIKEAATEWLDKKYAAIGKWTVSTIAGLIVAGLLVFAIKHG